MRNEWWFGRPPISLGLGVFVVVLSATLGAHDHNPVDVLGYLLLIAPAFVLLLRNRYPLTVFLVVGPLVGAYYLSGNPPGPAGLYLIFALFTLSLLRGAVVASIAAAGMFLYAVGTWFALGRLGEFDGRVGFVVAPVGLVIAAGAVLTARRNTLRALREQAEERTRRLAEEERLRIAREVHDVVAHSLAMINVQAGVGAHVADRRPEEAKAALLAIKEASRTALTDLRATLAVLRGAEDRAPAPSLRRLAELTGATTAAGLRPARHPDHRAVHGFERQLRGRRAGRRRRVGGSRFGQRSARNAGAGRGAGWHAHGRCRCWRRLRGTRGSAGERG